jgi:hypothetical protein
MEKSHPLERLAGLHTALKYFPPVSAQTHWAQAV